MVNRTQVCNVEIWIEETLKELQNYITTNYYCVRHKNRRKHNQHFKPLFFQAYLHFGTSNLLSTYRKTSLIRIISIHLVLLSLEIQRRVIQTKYTPSFFPLFKKEATPKPSNVATAKNIFSSVYILVTTCFDKCFLFHVITGRRYFYKSLLMLWGLVYHTT